VEKKTLLAEILGNLQRATDNCLKLLRAVLNSEHDLLHSACSCRHSLELAVWTPPERIDPEVKEKLDLLFL
jgi:hypothetical protein